MRKPEHEPIRRRVFKAMRTHFIAGIVVVVPVIGTIALLAWFFVYVDNFLQPIIQLAFGKRITGVGFGIAVVLIYLAGLLASNLIGRRIIRFGESLLARIPIFRQLYIGIKQVLEGLSGSALKKAAFREVVLVEFPWQGMKALAFITNEITDETGKKLVSLFVPTTPVPTSGYFIMVNEDAVTRTDLTVDEAMRMVVSGGMISPAQINTAGLDDSR